MAAPAAAAPPARLVTAEEASAARAGLAELDAMIGRITTALLVLGVGGLIFTATNVTVFAMKHETPWFIAWMLDPLVSLSLLAALYFDGKLAQHGYRPTLWPLLLRWFAGVATWLMNCWGSLYPRGFTGVPSNPDWAGLLLHSVIPFLVILLAEAAAGYRAFTVDRRAAYEVTVSCWKEQEAARRRAADEERRHAAEQRREAQEREAREAQERARAIEDAARLRSEQEHAAQLERDRIAAEAAAAERKAAAEAAAETQRLAAVARLEEERRQTAREEADRAETAERRRREWERQQAAERARQERESAEHAAAMNEREILAKAKAEALRIDAEAKAAAERAAAEAKLKAAEERRTRTAETTAGPTAETRGRSAGTTAETRTPRQRSTAETEAQGREARRRRQEEATFEAAVLIFLGVQPTRAEFAATWGMSESWARERYTEAEGRMSTDPAFQARVLDAAEQRTAPAVA